MLTSILLATVAVAQFPALLAYIGKLVIDALASGMAGTAHRVPATPILLGALFLVMLLLQHGLQTYTLFGNEELTELAAHSIHAEIMRAGLRREDLDFFEDPAFHNRRAILESHALYLPLNYLRFTTDIIASLCTLAGILFLLASVNILVPVFLLALAIPDVFVQVRSHHLSYEGVKETISNQRARDYYKAVLTTSEYAKEVRVYDLEQFFIHKYNEAFDQIAAVILPIRRKQVKDTLLTRLTSSIGIILPYAWIILRASRGYMSVGEVSMFLTAIVVTHQQLSRLAQTIAGHQDTINILQEFTAWIGTNPYQEPATNATPVCKYRGAPQIRIEDLWFKYSGASDFTLKGVNIEIPSGKSLAIVGKNGSGKTTLVKVLCRLHNQQRGRIYFDDFDSRDIDLTLLRTSVGVIFQDFIRYQLNVAENIAFREWCAGIRAQICTAARAAGAENLIKALPYKYNTFLGKEYPDREGVELSGGQWQRIALARAFFRESKLLILDEPTASLDTFTEANIYARFRAITAGKTTLLISHRMATVHLADLIAVMDDGKVIEVGTHSDLMLRKGVYHWLFTEQAQRYLVSSRNLLDEIAL